MEHDVALIPTLAGGLSTFEGRVTSEPVAAAHGLEFTPVAEVLGG